MGCVERHGYPQCYGAIYRNAGCTCPLPPRSKVEHRVVKLEYEIKELRVLLMDLTARVDKEESENG